MKRLTKLFGFIALAAFVFACNQPASQEEAVDAQTIKDELSISDLKIAYVLTDSVIAKFEFFKEKSQDIAEKGRKFESELSSRARGFEQEVANFQQSAQSMTMNQARAKEEELMKKERNLVTYRDNIMQELSSDEANLYSEVYDKVQEFLTEYAKENDLELILSYTRGGAVWYSKKSLDITDAVVEGINKKYEETKTATKK